MSVRAIPGDDDEVRDVVSFEPRSFWAQSKRCVISSEAAVVIGRE